MNDEKQEPNDNSGNNVNPCIHMTSGRIFIFFNSTLRIIAYVIQFLKGKNDPGGP